MYIHNSTCLCKHASCAYRFKFPIVVRRLYPHPLFLRQRSEVMTRKKPTRCRPDSFTQIYLLCISTIILLFFFFWYKVPQVCDGYFPIVANETPFQNTSVMSRHYKNTFFLKLKNSLKYKIVTIISKWYKHKNQSIDGR